MIVPVSIIQMEMKHEQTTLEPGLNLGDYHGTIANQTSTNFHPQP